MIFIDTGAFVARWLHRDQYHLESLAGWRLIAARGVRCATSSFVIDEALTLLGRRASYQFAAGRARNLYNSAYLEVLRPVQDDELAAIELFERYADQEVSFTDCVSFVLMQRRGLRKAFAFDRHFALAGFERWPE